MWNYQIIFNLKTRLKAVILLLFLVLTPLLPAKSYKGLKVKGNLRIESILVTSNGNLKPNTEYDKADLDQALDKIYKTGYFSKVDMKEENGYLIIVVKENPTINKLTKDGTKFDDMEKENLYLKENQVFSFENLKRDTIILSNSCTALGNLFSKVNPHLKYLDNNKIDIDFQISKSPSSSIHSVSFVGNRNLSDKILRLNMSSKSDKWYNIAFVGQTNYSAAALESDRDRIQKLYNSKGYLDAFVEDMVSEYLPSANGFYITMFIHEGKKYEIGDIGLSSNVEKLNPEDLRKHLTIKTGEDANIFKIRAQKYLLKNHTYQNGFMALNIVIKETLDRKNHRLNLVYEIAQKAKLVVREIRVKGNDRTRLSAILKCVKIRPGDILDELTLSESQQRLMSLQIFDSAQLIPEGNGVPGEVDIVVDLKESRKTTTISPTASYSGDRGLWLSVSFAEKNVLGTGNSLEGRLQNDKKDLDISLAYYNPFAMGKNLGAGLITSFNKKQSIDGNDFQSINFSLTPNLSYSLNKDTKQSIEAGFKYSNIKIATTSALFAAEEGSFNNIFVGTNLASNKLNSRIYPTKGYMWSLGFEINHLFGSDGTGFQTDINGMKALGVGHSSNLELSLKATVLNKFDSKKHIRIFESLNNTASDIRGFKKNGIGPRTAKRSNIGGNIKYAFRGEFNFSVGLPDEWQSRGFVFFDAGSIINTRIFALADQVQKSAKLRTSVGFGFKLFAPYLGKLGVAYTLPLNKEDYDETKRLLFFFRGHVL